MIINTLSESQRAEYYCNGINDDEVLVRFIANLRARGINTFTVEIIGTFVKKNTAAIVINNSGYTPITLDFSKCNQIISKGAFLNINNVIVKNCRVYHGANTADAGIYTLSAVDSVLEYCRITGEYASGDCRAFSISDSRLINCECEVTNNNGTIYGIYGSGNIVKMCDISVKSLTASAYGIEIAAGSFVSDCKFKGETTSTLTTASGNGGIGGGCYVNCLFIGIGNLKGQGFYLRAGYLLSASNCVYRGYTKNTASGWGIGLTGQANDGNTLILLGINCNQVDLSGYLQTKSMDFTLGYGVVAGLFFTAPIINSNITAIASYNRNRT